MARLKAGRGTARERRGRGNPSRIREARLFEDAMTTDDPSTWRSVFDGHRDAFLKPLAATIRGWVRRLLWSRNEADVEDLSQEVLIVLVRRSKDFDPTRASFRTWLYAIVIRTCRKWNIREWIRASREKSAVAEAACVPADALTQMNAEEQRLLERIREHVKDRLGSGYWAVLWLRVAEDWPIAQINQVMGLSRRQVQGRVARCVRVIESLVACLEHPIAADEAKRAAAGQSAVPEARSRITARSRGRPDAPPRTRRPPVSRSAG